MIDVHTHLLPPDWPNLKEKFGYSGFVQLQRHSDGCRGTMLKDDGGSFREVESNLWDVDVRLKECDQHQVKKQVLSTVPVMFNYWAKPKDSDYLSQFLNDHLAEVVHSHPDRFYGLGTLPLQDPKLSVKELERCKKELKLHGVQIGTHVNQWNLNDPEVMEVFTAAQDLGMSIFVHPWDMMGQERMKKYWLPWLVGMPAELSLAICSMIFGGVFERLPQLKVCFAHGGGAFPGTLGRIEHGYYARPDLCAMDAPQSPRSYLRRFYVDSLVHDENTLKFLADTFGVERIALGTDYPFPLGEIEPGHLIKSSRHFNEAEKTRMLEGTALEWLGVK